MALPTSGALTLANIQTEFGGTNPIGLNEYYAGGGLVPAGTSGTYGAVPSSGALSVQNFYGTTAFTPIYIEEVFSTYLYTGNGTSQTITNGIDLSTKGGMVITKARSIAYGNILVDTTRGVNNILQTSTTNAQIAESTAVTSVSTTGFSVGSYSNTNGNGQTFASWTFRKQPKFFDVVTYTGNGSSPRDIAHSLGSVPGCIFLKRTDSADNWIVYHRSIDVTNTGGANTIFLNLTAAAEGPYNYFGYTVPTSTTFKVGSSANINGATYVAYVFAHNAGGFGLTGSDSVISCGGYVGNGATNGQLINLGYEVQYVMIKNTTSGGNWFILDVMRGYAVNGNFGGDPTLFADSANAESNQVAGEPSALGFTPIQDNVNQNGQSYIYIAIRRGPMKVPTIGTSVFAPVTYAGTDTITNVTTNIVPSLAIVKGRGAQDWYWTDMLRGSTKNLRSNTTGAEQFDGTVTPRNTGFTLGVSNGFTNAGVNFISYSFLRAPKFFDEVCYTGTGVTRTVTHNLTVAPELMIVKKRNTTANWQVYQANLGATKLMQLDLNDASVTTSTRWANTEPTSSVFTVGSNTTVNNSGDTYVAYLFATCAGVSKVGSYTGTGATQTINCGFTSGARWVMIKRTDGIGDWCVFDTARGMVAGNDPALFINYSGAEEGGVIVYTVATGFQVSGTTQVNATGGSYIYLAIA